MIAVTNGNTRIVKCLLNANGVNVSLKDGDGNTALMRACEKGHFEIAHEIKKACYSEFGNGHHDLWTENNAGETALKIAIKSGNIEIATEVFMILHQMEDSGSISEYSMLSTFANEVFDPIEITELANVYGLPRNVDKLSKLLDYAVRYDFHFDLCMNMLPLFPSAIIPIHECLPRFFSLFSTEARGCDMNILYRLVRLYSTVEESKDSHPLERADLEYYSDKINSMVTAIMTSEVMNSPVTVKEVLCHASKKNGKTHKDEIVERANAFRVGPLDHCVHENVLSIFGAGSVSTYVNNLFWAFLRTRRDNQVAFPRAIGKRFFGFHIANLTNNMFFPKITYSLESVNLREFKSNLIYLRYCPAMMFFLEGISKLAYFIVVIVVLFRVPLSTINANFNANPWVIYLIIHTVGNFIYEYGEMCGGDFTSIPTLKSVQDYVVDIWNFTDVVSMVLVTSALSVAYNSHLDAKQGQACLAVSCIFCSIGLLRYFSAIEEVGKFTIVGTFQRCFLKFDNMYKY